MKVNVQTVRSERGNKHIFKAGLIAWFSDGLALKAIHIEGSRNEIADSLSRVQEYRFRSLAPNADLLPADIP